MKTFREYLEIGVDENTPQNSLFVRALRDKSDKSSEGTTKNAEVNTDLATVGDAVLKLVLKEHFMDVVDKLTEHTKVYEADLILVKAIGKHYDICSYLKWHKDGPKKDDEYYYEFHSPSGSKFIATGVEAVIGAIYKTETFGYNVVRNIVIKEFIPICDEHFFNNPDDIAAINKQK